MCVRQFDFELCFGLIDVLCLDSLIRILVVMYSGIVHVNYIKDGFCFLKSYVYCMVVLHHLHQTVGRLVPKNALMLLRMSSGMSG